MGSDIHGVVEQQVSPGKWAAIRVLASFIDEAGVFRRSAAQQRNYRRFAALAGVRGEGPAPRGMPADASETALLLFTEEGGHSPSWLPLDEATDVFAETDSNIAKALKASLQRREHDSSFNYYYFSEIGEGEDYRLVFWFDS